MMNRKQVIIISINPFDAKLAEINGVHILHFPKEVSETLPSRGMVMVKGTINQLPIQMVLEPDGKGSHWFLVNDDLYQSLQVEKNKNVSIAFEPLDTWHEPEVPNDLYIALKSESLLETWLTLTLKARWEWIRWIRFTNNPDTRSNRIAVTCSKLNAGKRRPCCFDQTRCTDTRVSKNGVLLD